MHQRVAVQNSIAQAGKIASSALPPTAIAAARHICGRTRLPPDITAWRIASNSTAGRVSASSSPRVFPMFSSI